MAARGARAADQARSTASVFCGTVQTYFRMPLKLSAKDFATWATWRVRHIAIEYRWAEGKPERMRELAEELVRLKVDVIMAPSSIYTEAAKRATSTIPIIFLSHADPLGTGHVASLARPGGNITGLSLMMTETNVKGLELFKEAVPGLSRVAVIFDPATPSHGPGLKAVEDRGPIAGASGSIGGRAQRDGV